MYGENINAYYKNFRSQNLNTSKLYMGIKVFISKIYGTS